MMFLRLLPALSLYGCADYEMARDDSYWGDSGAWGEADSDTDSDSDTDADTGTPEEENDFLALLPADTDAFVFVVNTSRNTVSRISVPQLDVLTAEVGSGPTVVRTTSDYSRAVTFNAASDDVSIINADTMEVETVAVRDSFNTLEMSADGRWVLCWRDPDVEVETDGGLQSFNEVSLVDTQSLQHYPLVVGFAPTDVKFTPDSTMAVVISDAYLGVIDLSGAAPTPRLVEIAEDMLNPPAAEEVEISPDSQYAFVRQYGETSIVLVELDTQTVVRLPAGDNPTDLDLSPDGEYAVVVSRDSNELRVFSVRDPLAPPVTLALPEAESIGSLRFSPDGKQAALYTNATAVAHYTLWDVESSSFDVRPLKKPVSSVAFSPDGATLLVFHTKADQAGVEDSYKGKHVMSVIEVSSGRENVLVLPAAASAFTHSDDGKNGFFIMEGEPWLEAIDYTTLGCDDVPLLSDPVHVGVLDTTRYAWVNQEHDLGRLTFYDPATQTSRTITGFELNSRIEH